MRRMVLANDGSEPALHAARFLARLPHDDKLELTVVSVVTPPFQGRTRLQREAIETYVQQDRTRMENAFAEIANLFDGANVSIENVVVEGHAGDEICSLAESRDCDLIVIGAKGHSAVSRILLGSTSDYVATKASCSVLVVRGEERTPAGHPLRILLGYEATGPARAAMEELSEIKWGKQVECHVVTVSYVYGLLGNDDIHEMRDSVQEAAAELCGMGMNAVSHIVENDHLGEGLVKYAEDHHCDIVVVGETPRSRLGRVLLGSISRFVIRHAPCSVWITRHRSIHGSKMQQGKETTASN